MRHTIPQTRNPEYGFYGALTRAGWHAESCWHRAVTIISKMTLHTHYGDIAVFLDSKAGRLMAEYMLDDPELSGAPADYRIKQAVRYWMGLRPDADMCAAGVPLNTPYLVAMLQLIALERQEA